MFSSSPPPLFFRVFHVFCGFLPFLFRALNLKLPSPVSPQTKRRLLLSTALLLILGGLLWWSRRGPTELDRYRAQLLAQGEILTLDQLAPIRTGNEPDGDEPLRLALSQMTNDLVPQSIWFLFTLTNGVQMIDWQHSANHHHSNTVIRIQNGIAEIESKRPSLLILHQSLTNLPAEKGSDYREVYNYRGPNHVRWRTVAQFLHHATVLDAYAGRYGHSFTNLMSQLQLIQHHREEWNSMTQLIRAHITKLACEDLNYGLAVKAWNDSQLAQLQSQLASISVVTNFYHSLVYERAIGVWAFAQARQNAEAVATNLFHTSGGGLKQHATILLWRNFAMDDDELNFLKLSQHRLDLIRSNLQTPNWARVPDQLRSQWEEMYSSAKTPLSRLKLNLTSSHFSLMNRGLQSLLYNETLRRQAVIAIALERHHLKHSHYPDTLDKLISEYLSAPPSDPINGQPMRYRLNTDDTFTLWSVGIDGQDNQGDSSIPANTLNPNHLDARDFVWPRLDPIDLPPKP